MNTKLNKLTEGFEKSFWVANVMELFERLAYYGQATILSLFLRNHLHFDEAQAGTLSSIFGGLIYMLPIFAGAVADKIGFRKAFSIAFFMLAIGYFLIGASGLPAFSTFFQSFGLYSSLTFVFIFTAIGGSFIKPSVLGTVAFTSTPETKSLGYAIYYWLVNIGAAIGPFLAYLVRDSFGLPFVYLVSALSCALMFVSTLIFYKEPSGKAENASKTSLLTLFTNLLKVLINFRFMALLLIYALYWLLFWQFFIVIPYYIDDFISHTAPTELIISIGAWTIIIFQIPVNRFTKNLSTTNSIILGFFLAALCWVIWYFVLPLTMGKSIPWFGQAIHPGLIVIGLGIFLFSIGEQIQAPRFYEYIADIAPKGQEALFQGYAFLPIAIAWGFGGTVGGWFYRHFVREGNNPAALFSVMVGIGISAFILIVLFSMYVNKKSK